MMHHLRAYLSNTPPKGGTNENDIKLFLSTTLRNSLADRLLELDQLYLPLSYLELQGKLQPPFQGSKYAGNYYCYEDEKVGRQTDLSKTAGRYSGKRLAL